MELSTLSTETEEIELSVDDREAAGRFIAAIVRRQPHATTDPAVAIYHTRELWERFGSEYAAATSGPYARRGRAALCLALGRL